MPDTYSSEKESCDQECRSRGVPDHLHAIGRTHNSCFEPTEKLYRRVPRKHFTRDEHTGEISVDEAHVSGMCALSVLRASCCKDVSDVYFDASKNSDGPKYRGWGAVLYVVGNLSGSVAASGQSLEPLISTVSPDPLQCMFPHCQVIIANEHGTPLPVDDNELDICLKYRIIGHFLSAQEIADIPQCLRKKTATPL